MLSQNWPSPTAMPPPASGALYVDQERHFTENLRHHRPAGEGQYERAELLGTQGRHLNDARCAISETRTPTEARRQPVSRQHHFKCRL